MAFKMKGKGFPMHSTRSALKQATPDFSRMSSDELDAYNDKILTGKERSLFNKWMQSQANEPHKSRETSWWKGEEGFIPDELQPNVNRPKVKTYPPGWNHSGTSNMTAEEAWKHYEERGGSVGGSTYSVSR